MRSGSCAIIATKDEAAVQLGRTLIEYGGDPIEPAAFRRSIRQFVSLGIDVAQASRSR